MENLILEKEDLDKWYEDLKLKPNTLVILFGIGNGVYLKKIVDSSEDINIILYEPNVFSLDCNVKDYKLESYVNKIKVYTNKNNIKNIMKEHINIYNSDRVLFIPYKGYATKYRTEFTSFKLYLEAYVSRINIKNRVIMKYGKYYVRNILHNYTKYFKGSKRYEDIKESINHNLPVYIVSAGPSLDNNIKELKNINGYIISVDTATNALINNGIVPDLIISVDALKNKDHLNKSMPDIPLICYLNTNMELLDNHNGDKVFIDSEAHEFHVKQFLKDHGISLPKFSTGGSVSCTAFSIALDLGFSDIVFVGLDLSYINNKTYSKDTISKDKPMESNRTMIKNTKDKEVYTTKIFSLYKKWFENKIESIFNNNHIYNATEGENSIKGAYDISLKEYNENHYINEEKTPIIFEDNSFDIKEDYSKIVIDRLSENRYAYEHAVKFIDIIIDELNEKYQNLDINNMEKIINKNIKKAELDSITLYITYRIQKEIKQLILKSINHKEKDVEYFNIKRKYCVILINEINSVIKEIDLG